MRGGSRTPFESMSIRFWPRGKWLRRIRKCHREAFKGALNVLEKQIPRFARDGSERILKHSAESGRVVSGGGRCVRRSEGAADGRGHVRLEGIGFETIG